ncbi:MAG TPA: hypothetical protein VFH52_11160 [Rhodanobacteraceae bacterium]|nr:hypothetical protein [Rhodanobacteraceae bacterium]
MKLDRWLPYASLQTRHLRLTLATARVIAWIGVLLIAGGIAWGITALWLRADSNAAAQYAMMAATSVIGLIGYGLLALALSGVLAALVGIEESQRRRVERE